MSRFPRLPGWEVHDMNRHSNFGFSTILLTFVMLCILTFSALALISANSDYRLSKKMAENNTAYYEAEVSASRTLATIDAALAEAFSESSDEASYVSLVEETVPPLCDGEFLETEDGYRIAYSVPIRDGQSLSVILSVRYPGGTGEHFYEITEWKSIHETTFTEEEPLNLLR
jgi:hypothetical protein